MASSSLSSPTTGAPRSRAAIGLPVLILIVVGAVIMCISSSSSSSSISSISVNSNVRPRNRNLASPVISIRDPKSIVSKSTSASNNNNDNNNRFEQLKFLFLGPSRTSGHKLEHIQLEAFPWLLSENPTNLGINAGRSIYPHNCLYSFLHQNGVGDVAFDVIVLEYEFDANVTIALAKRVRARFPKAKIIILEMWLLLRWFHQPTSQSMAGWMDAWLLQNVGSKANKASCSQIRNAILQDAPKNNQDWRYTGDVYTPDLVQEAASFGAQVLKVPVPPDIYAATDDHACYFETDMHHYNVEGHRLVANHIYNHLIQTNMRTHHDSSLGKWETEDQCLSWFQNGKITLQHSPNIVMNKFAPRKFALEVPSAGKSWLKVHNANPAPQYLYLNRMIASPDFKYPSTKVWIHGDQQQPPAISVSDEPFSSTQVNVEGELFIGIIPPGESTIMIQSLQQGKEWPFRIVGIQMYSI
jgi:hypothetical protein